MAVRRHISNHWPYAVGLIFFVAMAAFPSTMRELVQKSGLNEIKFIEMAFNFFTVIVGFLFFAFSLLLTSADKFVVKLRSTTRFGELQYLYMMTFILTICSIFIAFLLVVFEFNLVSAKLLQWLIFSFWTGMIVTTLIYFGKSVRIFYVIVQLPRN